MNIRILAVVTTSSLTVAIRVIDTGNYGGLTLGVLRMFDKGVHMGEQTPKRQEEQETRMYLAIWIASTGYDRRFAMVFSVVEIMLRLNAERERGREKEISLSHNPYWRLGPNSPFQHPDPLPVRSRLRYMRGEKNLAVSVPGSLRVDAEEVENRTCRC